MSVLTEVTRLEGAKADIKTAIENKGITVPDNLLLDGYAELIEKISGGNFEIIGAAEAPANPKDNTLWVKTEETITSWVIDYAQPTPAEGMVWIGVDFSSDVSLNAFAINTLNIYPISCEQYSGGVWTTRGLQLYQNEEWIVIVDDPDEFPIEPTAYALLNTYTASGIFEAPENGYFQIEAFGASGNGGNGYSSGNSYSGGGGGGGGYACSRIKINKGDTVALIIGAVGATTSVTVNSSVESYSNLSVTSGANGTNGAKGAPGTGGAGGVASGGNYVNANGKAGSDGKSAAGTGAVGGAGGAAGYTGGNAGGAGGNSDNAGKAGFAGFIKIYRGNTNVA